MELKNEWKLIIDSLNDSIIIKMFKNYYSHFYSKKYDLEELLNFKLFKSYSKIENIISCIKSIIEQNNYDIEENYKKRVNLILKCSLPDIQNLIFKLPNKNKDKEEMIELIIKEIKKEKELKENKIKEDEIKEKTKNKENNNNIKEENNNNIKEEKNNNIKEENNNNIRKENKEDNNNIKEENKEDNNNIKEEDIEDNNNIKEEDIENKEIINNKNENYIILINKVKNEDIKKEINILNYCDKNKKEIEESCKIFKESKFDFKYNFNEEGEYNFIFSFNQLLTNTSYMFNECSSLTSLNLSNFNTNNVIDMHDMFSYCSSLTFLNLSNFNTNNVNDMKYMFYGCSSLTSLNLYNFNTNNVNNMIICSLIVLL